MAKNHISKMIPNDIVTFIDKGLAQPSEKLLPALYGNKHRNPQVGNVQRLKPK